jgi:hypothetical protein
VAPIELSSKIAVARRFIMGAGCLIKSLSIEWLQWQSVVLRSAHTQRKAAGNNQGEKPVQDATGPKPVVDNIDVRPGDHWTYQAIDNITGRTKFTADYTFTEIRGHPLWTKHHRYAARGL